jgi:tRNA(Ile2) C34 agmatinyltransferase TiaS
VDNFLQHSCFICNQTPVVIPYKTSCGHLCCYTCLRMEVLNHNLDYRCRVCGEKIESSRPLLDEEEENYDGHES